MIRIDAIWLAVEPVDMRAGADRLLARVVQVGVISVLSESPTQFGEIIDPARLILNQAAYCTGA